jgi:CubicO group peptidase (beta-lactamase class C family)
MIGTVILELVDQRKLRLDQPIARWFPQLPDATQVTIRELGNMSSGIASYTTDTAITNRYFNRPTMWWTPDQLIAGGAALPRLFTPGHGFNYSDTNFVMLGRIIELVTHRPLARVMQTMLFRPLGMNASSYPTNNRLPSPYLRGSTIQRIGEWQRAGLQELEPELCGGGGTGDFDAGGPASLDRRAGHRPAAQTGDPARAPDPNLASAGDGREYLLALAASAVG